MKGTHLSQLSELTLTVTGKKTPNETMGSWGLFKPLDWGQLSCSFRLSSMVLVHIRMYIYFSFAVVYGLNTTAGTLLFNPIVCGLWLVARPCHRPQSGRTSKNVEEVSAQSGATGSPAC